LTIQTHTLSNGFRIVTEHMPGLKSASIGVWVQAGGRHERVEQNGIAHFLEHMAFKGTARRTSLQIAEAIEDVGGYINAYTSREATAYYVRVLEDDVALGLDVIADILLNPLFRDEDVEVERGVILQEIGMTNDTPDDIVFDTIRSWHRPRPSLGICLRWNAAPRSSSPRVLWVAKCAATKTSNRSISRWRLRDQTTGIQRSIPRRSIRL